MQNYQGLPVDLSNCDTEPIGRIGRIQPHGFLLVVSLSSLIIEQVSENVSQYLHIDSASLLNTSLIDLLEKEEYATLEKAFLNPEKHELLLLPLKGVLFYAFIHQLEEKIILECEPYSKTAELDILQSNTLLSQLLVKLNGQHTLVAISTLVVDFVQCLLDYDRVLLFQFDEQWNGGVIAQKIKPGIHSFQGHHFPASDIPLPARALLEQKHIRHIPDVGASSVVILPYNNPTSGAPANLLTSELRNPSEIHLEYLRNMAVEASLSFSVIVKGKLWGLITCHNERAKLIEVWKRQLGDIVAKSYANVILSSEQKRDFQRFEHFKHLEKSLLDEIIKSSSIKTGLFNHNSPLLEITQSTGAALFLDNELLSIGETPTESELLALIAWVSENNTAAPFCTQELSKYLPQAIHYREKASGLLALEISGYAKEYLLLFKPQIMATKIWAGNPQKPLLGEDQRMHPRQSFAKWEEQVQGRSLPWTVNVQEISQILVKDMISFRLRDQARKLEELNQQLHLRAGELKTKNEDLEEFAAIITHNLRAPMNSITGLYAYYQKDPTPERAGFVMEHIKTVNDNMRATMEDLSLILKTRIGQPLPKEQVNLEEIIEKEKQNLEAMILEREAEITLELEAPSFTIPRVYMESIIHNFLSNALKYHSPTRKPTIKITSYVEKDQFYLSFSDNGLGMDLNKVGHKLFGLYKIFHENKDSKGLGLYLTKRQVESLGGSIRVESKPDEGSTFTLVFNTHQGR